MPCLVLIGWQDDKCVYRKVSVSNEFECLEV